MSKYISGKSLSEIIRQLEYKSKRKKFYLNKRKWKFIKCNNKND